VRSCMSAAVGVFGSRSASNQWQPSCHVSSDKAGAEGKALALTPGAWSPSESEDVTLTNHSKLPNALPMALLSLLEASPLPFKKHCFSTPEELPNFKCCGPDRAFIRRQPRGQPLPRLFCRTQVPRPDVKQLAR